MYNLTLILLDRMLFGTVAVAGVIMVQPARNGLSNFTSSLEEPAIMVNYFLQGDPYQGMVHFTRFFLNTLLGMGGFIDVAGNGESKLQRALNRIALAVRWAGMAWGMGLIYENFRSTAASRCVKMAGYGGPPCPVLSWLTGQCPWEMDYREGMKPAYAVAHGLRGLRQSSILYIMVREGVLPAS